VKVAMYRALRGEYPHEDSIVVSSPLRRALSTVAIGLRYRFASAPTEKIRLVDWLTKRTEAIPLCAVGFRCAAARVSAVSHQIAIDG